MDNFAQIKPLFKYNKVAYYSIVINDHEKSLFEEFMALHQESNKTKLYHILKWIQIIGQKYGAQPRFFRNEAHHADATALPPKGTDREPCYVEKGKNKANTLRLYCLRANEHVVFLFSGDVKTTKKAQDCPNVKPHFLLANQLATAIDEAFKNRDIRWTEDNKFIEVENDFKLYY